MREVAWGCSEHSGVGGGIMRRVIDSYSHEVQWTTRLSVCTCTQCTSCYSVSEECAGQVKTEVRLDSLLVLFVTYLGR